MNIIFDLDDTLIQTQHLYDQAKLHFYSAMSELGFHRNEVEVAFEQIDRANVSRYGLSIHRFAMSMCETYRNFAGGTAAYEVIDDRCRFFYELGISVAEDIPPLMDNALEILQELRKRREHLYLYTGGDFATQRHKIEAHNLTPFFRKHYIVHEHPSAEIPSTATNKFRFLQARKGRPTLAQLIAEEGLRLEDTWMIGNSLKSDINPALDIGIKCVWFKSASWSYDLEPMLSGNVWEIENLMQLISVLYSKQKQFQHTADSQHML